MIGSNELAERLYEAWRRQQDLVNPAPDDRGLVRDSEHHLVQLRRDRPRPKWAHLDSFQQSVWRNVAKEIGGVLADATA